MLELKSLAALLFVIALTGCGGQHGVWSVRTGMSREEVRARLGAPEVVVHAAFEHGRELCWTYPARKKGTSIEGRNFCFHQGRVAHIGTSNHF